MLQKFELEDQRAGIQPEILGRDLENRRTPDVGPDQPFGFSNPLPGYALCLDHGSSILRQLANCLYGR